MEEIKTKKFDKWIKILSVVFGIILIMIIIIFGLAEVINLFWTILSIVIVLLVAAAIFLFFHFLSKRKEVKEEEKITKKEIITLEQAREIAKKATQCPEYADYNDDGLGESISMLGNPMGEKIPIYARFARGEYKNDIYCVLINMINPNYRTILINPEPDEVNRAAKLLAEVSLPEEEEEVIREFPTGVIEKTRRRAVSLIEKQKEEKAKEAEKEEI